MSRYKSLVTSIIISLDFLFSLDLLCVVYNVRRLWSSVGLVGHYELHPLSWSQVRILWDNKANARARIRAAMAKCI